MLRRSLFISTALLLFCCTAWYVYCVLTTGSNHRANIIVLTVESLRSDMVRQDTMPNLMNIAEGGFTFKNHRAISGWTGTNIVSLLTGISPFDSGVHTRGQSLDKKQHTALEVFGDKNYLVEGIQGFMTMDIYKNLGLDISPQLDEPLYKLALSKQENKPFFFWYHYVHTHLPYSTPGGYETEVSRKLRQKGYPKELAGKLEKVWEKAAIPHDEEKFRPEDTPFIQQMQSSTIAEFDDWFRHFWDFFVNSGLSDDTVLILTADHGDEHGERGMVGHASTTQLGHLHEEIIRVPLFIWLPQDLDVTMSKGDTDFISTHIDIMPTLYSLLGIDPSMSLSGRDLFTDKRDSTWQAMTSSGGFAEPLPNDIRYYEYGTLAGKWKLLLKIENSGSRSFQLYNLENDPGEQKNIASLKPHLVEELASTLQPLIESRTRVSSPGTEPATAGKKPEWLHPAANNRYNYDDMNEIFMLEWSGSKNTTYQLEYSAGSGLSRLSGFLEVEGTKKDFGNISRRYWNTWIVPNSPVRLRVREENSSTWSDWLQLEATP